MSNTKNFEIDPGKVFAAIDTATAAAPKRRGRPPKEQSQKKSEMPRLNISLEPEIFAYIKTMSGHAGTNATEYIRMLLRRNYEENRKLYEEMNKAAGKIKI